MLLFSPDLMHVEKRFNLSSVGLQIESKICAPSDLYKDGRNKAYVILFIFFHVGIVLTYINGCERYNAM